MSAIVPNLAAPAGNASPSVTATQPPVADPPPTVVLVDTVALQAALAKFVKVVGHNNARPIIQGIRIAAADGHLNLLGTDLEVTLHVSVPATIVGAPCAVIVAHYKALFHAARATKDRQTRLAITGECVIVSDSASSSRVFAVGGGDDFPKPPSRLTLEECVAMREASAPAYQRQNAVEFEKKKKEWLDTLPLEFQEFAISAASLSSALLYVLPGMADGDSRNALNGVLMTGNGHGGAEFVASNAHVLYKHDAALSDGTLPGDVGFVMLPTVAEWLAKNASGTVRVKTDPNTVFFEGDGFSLTGRRIEGIFPRYRDLIPAQTSMPGRLTVNRKELLAALKTACPNIVSDTRRIDLVPNAEGTSLLVRAMYGTTTTFSVEIPAASRKWLTHSFNADFLIDFLAVHPGDTVTICHDEPGAKGCGGPCAVYDGERLFLIMPLSNGLEPTPEELDAHRAALAEPDQQFPTASIQAVKPTKKAPPFKFVVAHAKVDSGYLSALLSALGVQSATAI